MGGEAGAEIRIGGFVHADGNGMERRQTAIGALVERHTRYVMLFPLRDGSTAEAVRNALTETVQTATRLSVEVVDLGSGQRDGPIRPVLHRHRSRCYFCDPKSPWQRGSNENTDGLLRQ